MEGCARAWLAACLADREWDISERPSIRAAFDALLGRKPQGGRPVFWPAPGEFLANLPQEHKPAAPYHQPFNSALALEWNKNRGNRSTVAKAHATYNASRLGITVPDWAMPGNDAESTAILRLIESIHEEQIELRRQHGIPERKEGSSVARTPKADAGVCSPDAVVPQARPERDSGRDVERRDGEREAVESDEYGEHLSRRTSRVDPDVCSSWNVYREDAA